MPAIHNTESSATGLSRPQLHGLDRRPWHWLQFYGGRNDRSPTNPGGLRHWWRDRDHAAHVLANQSRIAAKPAAAEAVRTIRAWNDLGACVNVHSGQSVHNRTISQQTNDNTLFHCAGAGARGTGNNNALCWAVYAGVFKGSFNTSIDRITLSDTAAALFRRTHFAFFDNRDVASKSYLESSLGECMRMTGIARAAIRDLATAFASVYDQRSATSTLAVRFGGQATADVLAANQSRELSASENRAAAGPGD